MLTGAMFMLEVYDRVLPSRSMATLLGLVVLVAGLYVALGILDALRGRILARIGGALDETLSGRVYDTLVRLPLRIGSRSEGNHRCAILTRSALIFPVSVRSRCSICPGYRFILQSALPSIRSSALPRSPERSCSLRRGADRALMRAPTGSDRSGHRAQWPRRSQPSQRRALTAMGMVSRMAARWGDANRQFLRSQRRTSDAAAASAPSPKCCA